MKIVSLVVALAAAVNAHCECLKCSDHFEGVDLADPNGDIKAVFERPECESPVYAPAIEGPYAAKTPAARASKRANKYKLRQCRKPRPQQLPWPEQYCNPIVKTAQTSPPLPTSQFGNLQYGTDTVLVPNYRALPEHLIPWLQNSQINNHQCLAALAEQPCSCCNCNRCVQN
ncbi:uncharacterized protein [Euwallacea fornicatus]|uniref:uncharacterized protein n=1 Tax=Euwallacea fornicatus TaxID=995702 RepID=UPI00338FE576